MPNDKTTANDGDAKKGIEKSALPADVGKLDNDKAKNPQNESETTQADATTTPQNGGGQILGYLSGWWNSLKLPDNSNRLIAIATVVIAVATVFTFVDVHTGSADTHALAVSAGSQASAAKSIADATSSAVQVNRDALESVQRAFLIFPQPLDTLATPDPANATRISSWGFMAKMENSGTTPTREAGHHVSWAHMPSPIPDGFDFADRGDPTLTPFMIGPKQPLSTGAMQIAPEMLEAVRNHTDRLYFWGWATYRDVFKGTPEHITMFCLELTGVRGADTRLVGNNLIAFLYANCTDGGAHHNCADDECKGEEYGSPSRRWPN